MATESSTLKTYLPRVLGLIVLIAAAYWGFTAYRHGQQYESTDNAQIEGSTAPVLARVAGYVQDVNVDDYATVKRGQPLLTIDPQEYEVALQQAEADYESTLADIRTAQADIRNAQADLATAQANSRNTQQSLRVTQSNAEVQAARRSKAQADLQRDQNLFNDQSLTRKQLDDSKNNLDVQERTYRSSEEQIALARSQQGVAQAGILKAQAGIQRTQANIQKMQAMLKVKAAAVQNAKLRLGYAKLTAPIDGKIGKKTAVVGQYVQPGQTLMTIVNNSTFWVVANFKETQLEKMQVGQDVEIKLDAYPDLDVKGRVASLSESTGAKTALLPPDNASGNFVKITQRVPVKIEILNPDQLKDKLRAGLSVDAAVRVAN
ncbi:HlyD family secretion protein [Fibrella sp. WM1]|uniref:HlyD family secretion protein n=1 Tax=Fibrella musci TaxID=3242485 RepID=UPI003522E13B